MHGVKHHVVNVNQIMISVLNVVIDIHLVLNGQLLENVQKIHIGWQRIAEKVVIDVVQQGHKFVLAKYNKQQLLNHALQNVILRVVSMKIFVVNFGVFKVNVHQMQHGWLAIAELHVDIVSHKNTITVVVKIIIEIVLLGLV